MFGSLEGDESRGKGLSFTLFEYGQSLATKLVVALGYKLT